ncbi:F-box domain-containing protein [Myriangium duriaei CBS 260.36]|uniref:F-box domain-containing protein n=1 Tax=Myriangium duriaei CBS 260.36 TaxID=1168546 RepID=A0A9P4J5D7_9PEZI|nr:F-box domain-containing protein [Myriangium duriaei CBS 260.36]
MSPPVALADLEDSAPVDLSRPTKKVRLDDTEDESNTSLSHPLGVRPAGNAYLARANLKAAAGGFRLLPDELIAIFLECLEACDLLRLGGTCRALHAFTRNEELWRALFTESNPSSFSWRGTWRSTYLGQDRSREPKVDCSNLFSDVLHRPFFCSHIPLEPYVTNIPARNQIVRLSDCGPDTVFESDRPLILTNPTRRWPVFNDWTVDTLLQRYPAVKFRAEAVDWPFKTYVDYLRNNGDESPLYLFDRAFADKMGLSVPDSTAAMQFDQQAQQPSNQPRHDSLPGYWPPTCFGSDQDLFSVLGSQRPDHRWLIVGSARSGSTFHKDPNGTSAWNAVLRGSKYWIMFPSSASLPPPPGVFVSEDQSEVTSPLSIAEWLLTFHAEARAAPGCKEGICAEGELLYVPAGWYHLVLNLDESVALTQNFVPRHGLAEVLSFLRDRPEQVTGFRDVQDPYALFVEKLREKEPGLLEEALQKLDRKAERSKGKWEQLVAKNTEEEDAAGGGFSFGFGGDDDDVEVP